MRRLRRSSVQQPSTEAAAGTLVAAVRPRSLNPSVKVQLECISELVWPLAEFLQPLENHAAASPEPASLKPALCERYDSGTAQQALLPSPVWAEAERSQRTP
jgi:hypothetical protein